MTSILLDLTPPSHDICILERVRISSTYLESGDFKCILNLSQLEIIQFHPIYHIIYNIFLNHSVQSYQSEIESTKK